MIVKDLRKQKDWSVTFAFKTIDRYNEQFINEANLNDFFRHNGIVLLPSELYAIIRRMSTHCDAKVSMVEFAAFLGESDYRPIDQQHRYEHRALEFQTASRLDANIERSIKGM